MSLTAHRLTDLPSRGSPDAHPFASGTLPKVKTLFMQCLRMALALTAIAAVVIAAAGLKLAVWLPTYLH